jgi:hypothetical protein
MQAVKDKTIFFLSFFSVQMQFLFIYLFLFYSYVHAMFGSFLPLSLHPPLPPHSLPYPTLLGRNYSALISNVVEESV